MESRISQGDTPSQSQDAVGSGVFILDQGGRILDFNDTARKLWQAGQGELIGEAFASLFAFEVVSRDPEWLDSQWEVLTAAALDQSIPLQAQPRESAPLSVRLRLEKGHQSNASGFFAFIDTEPKAPAPAAAAADTKSGDSGLDLLVRDGGAGYFDLNFRENQVHYSPGWKKLLGYVDAELPNTYDTWLKLIHPEDSAAAPDKLGSGKSAGSHPFQVEFRMRHRRGHDIWIQSLGLQVVGEDGKLERVVGLHFDITDRKELEESALIGDERLQSLVSEQGPNLGAFELDFQRGEHWFSPAWRHLLGHENAPDEEATFLAVLPAEVAQLGVRAYFLGRANPAQASISEVVSLRHRDGRTLAFLMGAHRTLNRKHELTRIVGFLSPLPGEGLASPDALAPALTATLLQTMAEAVIICDERGRIAAANPSAARLLRRELSAIQGQLVGDVFSLVNRQTGNPSETPLDRALRENAVLPLIAEDALLPPEGSPAETAEPISIVWTARIARDDSGKPRGAVIVFRDPNEMSLTPNERIRANRFESLGLLAGGVAHDFNNLLTTILGGISLAKDNRDYSRLVEAEGACMSAKGLTRQLLAFAKGSPGSRVVVGPRGLLEEAVKVAAAGSEAVIAVETDDDLEPVLVDRGQMLQVFQNLVINSIQAMPPAPHQGQVQLRAQQVSLKENEVPPLAAGSYIRFEVRDNGSGIKPEFLERIWDPFFTTKKHGTGLGLATAHSIIRQHDGLIGVESTEGVGTAFTIFLPVADRPEEVQARKPATLRFGTGRVLFMDDDAAIVSLTSSMLESLDYKFDVAKNGEEALTLYKRYLNIGRPYDVVIMDLTVIGGMGGEQCFKELKQMDPDVRAIVSSGYDNDELARQFLDQGFCGYLTKPYRVTDLGKVLKAVLG